MLSHQIVSEDRGHWQDNPGVALLRTVTRYAEILLTIERHQMFYYIELKKVGLFHPVYLIEFVGRHCFVLKLLSATVERGRQECVHGKCLLG